MKNFLIAISVLIGLGGCVSKPVTQPSSAELSLDLPQYSAKNSDPLPIVLGVRAPYGIVIESDKISYIDTNNVRRSYAYHRWEGSIARQLHERLVLAIAQREILKDVAKQGQTIKPDWILETEVLEFAQKMQDENSANIQFVGRMRLVDANSKEAIDDYLVKYEIPMESLGTLQATQAFNRAVSMWLDETLQWIEKRGEIKNAR